LKEGLTFLDISYAIKVTDEGMAHFKEKILPISKLFVNGLTGITHVGMTDLLHACY